MSVITVLGTQPPFPPERCRGKTCAHRPSYDPETLEPQGPACGSPATQVIFWRDQRYSPACGEHGLEALDPDSLDLVLCIEPIAGGAP